MIFKLNIQKYWILAILALNLILIVGRSIGQPIATPIELKADDIQQIVNAHNHFRGMVEPPASNMQQVEWNTELAMVAQAYAETCMFGENTERAQQAESFDTVGENRAFGRSTNYTDLIERGWFVQRANFDYDANMCLSPGVCDEYTQLVWAETNLVGCGVANCPTVTGLPILPNAVVLVCNYAPEGNVPDERPYEEGQPCSNCPTNMPMCVNNTCSSRENMVVTTTTEQVPITTTNTDPPPTTVNIKVRPWPVKCDGGDEDSRDSESSDSSDSSNSNESK